GQAALAPDVDLLDGAAVFLDHVEERVQGRGDGALLEARVEDHHDFVMAHECAIPPMGSSAVDGPRQEGAARVRQNLRRPADLRDATAPRYPAWRLNPKSWTPVSTAAHPLPLSADQFWGGNWSAERGVEDTPCRPAIINAYRDTGLGGSNYAGRSRST